jgi:hypothetical protein
MNPFLSLRISRLNRYLAIRIGIKFLYQVAFVIALTFSLFRFVFIVLINKRYEFILVDVDNTVADTWPGLVNNEQKIYCLEFYRHLEVLGGTRSFLLNLIESSSSNVKVVYISARPLGLHKVTKDWLIESKLPVLGSMIILVPRPSVKLMFIKILVRLGIKVSLIDDLSYNMENGTTKFYINVINEIESMKVTYYNKSFILKINNKEK